MVYKAGKFNKSHNPPPFAGLVTLGQGASTAWFRCFRCMQAPQERRWVQPTHRWAPLSESSPKPRASTSRTSTGPYPTGAVPPGPVRWQRRRRRRGKCWLGGNGEVPQRRRACTRFSNHGFVTAAILHHHRKVGDRAALRTTPTYRGQLKLTNSSAQISASIDETHRAFSAEQHTLGGLDPNLECQMCGTST